MTNSVKSLHELAKEMLNKANVVVLKETGKLKKEPDHGGPDDAPSMHSRKKSDSVKKLDAVGAKIAKIRSLSNPAKAGFAAAKQDDAERDALRKAGKKIPSRLTGIKEEDEREHGPGDDEDSLDRAERKKQHQNRPPFKPDKAKSTVWTSAKSKAKNLARAAMKKAADKKKLNEDEEELTELSKEKLGKYAKRAEASAITLLRRPKRDDKKIKQRIKGVVDAQRKINEADVDKTPIDMLSVGTKEKKQDALVNELSKETMSSYKKKANDQIKDKLSNKNMDDLNSKDKHTVRKRAGGVDSAKWKMAFSSWTKK